MNEFRKNNCGNTMAGVKALYLIDTHEAHVKLNGNGVKVELLPGSEWTKVEGENIKVRTTSVEGNGYQNSVEAKLFGKSNNYNPNFEKMVNKRYLLRVVDNNDKQWLIGEEENPMRFEWEDMNNGTAQDETCYIMKFRALTRCSQRMIIN